NVTPNAFITHPAVATILRSTLKDNVAGAAYLMENGQMAGLPVATTNQLEAASASLGRVIVGDFSQILIGQWGSVDILANPYAQDSFDSGSVQIRVMAT